MKNYKQFIELKGEEEREEGWEKRVGEKREKELEAAHRYERR